MKKILFILLAVAVVGGGVTAGIILTRGGGADATYSNYGFSIEYDKGMTIIEEGMIDPAPNDNSGLVAGEKEDDTHELFVVGWIWIGVEVNISELEDALNETFVEAWEAQPDVTMFERGGFECETKSGHDMIYQSFTLTIHGETLHGVWGAWYCDQDKKMYLLLVMRADEATEMWQRYVDSFVCH